MNNNDKRKMVHAMLTSFAKIDTHYKRKFDTIQQKSSVKLEYGWRLLQRHRPRI